MGFIVLLITSVFVACFMATQAVMTAVYGQELKANGSAYIGLGASTPTHADVVKQTEDAADQAQGYMIDSYVQSIKAEICPTLKNITAEAECLAI